MSLIYTTQGMIEEATLARTVVFRDQPTEFVIEVEWRLDGALVKRSAHLILKDPSVVATAVAGSVGPA
jgi:hypothetical protein